MDRLNHINLAVSDVPGVSRFFERAFGFRVAEKRGQDTFAVLVGEDNFVLVVMYDKKVAEGTYPGLFHVGFLVDSNEKVREYYERIVGAGFACPEPAEMNRGWKSFGFYCTPPGGVMVEVSCSG